VIGEASTGEEGIVLTKQLDPDIVLMDLDMPGICGFFFSPRQ
jgi:two-component system nitrate/nitrite response regulator NarL